MRAYDQGAFIRVTADHRDVHRFARRWPGCSLGPYSRVSATFDAQNGDLVDLDVRDGGGIEDVPPALLEDMQNYAARRLNRPEIAR